MWMISSSSFPVQRHTQCTLAVILLRVLGAPLSWKKLEFDACIEWNAWHIQPARMTAQLPKFKFHKTTLLIDTLLERPCRKNLEKIIGTILWATSMVHHTRFLITSLYRDLYAIPATNYSIQPTQWEYFLSILNEDATISVHNNLHLPLGARIVEFKHSNITSKLQLPADIPIERQPGYESEIPTLTNESFQMNPNKHCNGYSTHSCLFSHPSLSIDTVISQSMQQQMPLQMMTQWALEVG